MCEKGNGAHVMELKRTYVEKKNLKVPVLNY